MRQVIGADYLAWSFHQPHRLEVSGMRTRHLPAAFAVICAVCYPEESARSSEAPRNFLKGVERSGWPFRWIVGCRRVSCRSSLKNATTQCSVFRDVLWCLFHFATRVTVACMTDWAHNLQRCLQTATNIATPTSVDTTVF